MSSHLETSPELGAFFDQISSESPNVESLLAAINSITDADEKERALEALNEARSLSAQDLRRLREALSQEVSVETRERREFSDEEIRDAAEYTIQRADTLPIQGDREVYLFQYFFNQTDISADIWVDGEAGPETKRTIVNNIRATQIFLRELDEDSAIILNGTLDATTVAAIREQFGISIEAAAVAAATEAAQAAIDELANLSVEELIVRLEAATTLRDKGSYTALLANRFRDAGYIIRLWEDNSFQIFDGETLVNLEISEENLGAIMVLMSISQEDINGDVLDENIPNNIFDGVVVRYDFQNSAGDAWTAQDFIVDDVRIASDVETNKRTCIAQIDAKISELQAELESESLNESQKALLRERIQELEVAKVFVRDRNIFARQSLEIAQYVGGAERDIARLLGNTLEEQRRLGGTGGISDIRRFLMSQIPTAIFAWFFMLLAKLLPSPLEEAAMAFIGAIAGLSVVEDAQEQGFIGDGRGDPDGINRRDVTSTRGTEVREAIRNILTDAPAGLEARHETVYALMVQKNNEGNHIDERENLDTIFLFLSQDYEFGQKNISELDDLNATTVWDTLSEYSKTELMSRGITGEDMLSFIRILKSNDISDTADEQIEDLFISGQVTESANRLDITWVQWNVFDEQNERINMLVSQISGISYGASEELRTNSVRAQVEEALAHAQPNILSWLWQAVAERTSFVGDQVPTAENIGLVLDALLAIDASGEDATHIQELTSIYTAISEELTLNETVHIYLAEASAVYTFTGSVGRAFSDVVFWVQGWGNTIPVDNREPITIERIDELIAAGITHAGNLDDNEALQTDVTTTVENLRLYKINLLDEQARVDGITSTERDHLLAQSDETLAAIIVANPEIYMQTLENLEAELAELKNTYTNTQAYLGAMSGNISEITTLQRFTRLSTGNNEFDTAAQRIYDEVYTHGIEANFRAHLAAKSAEMTSFDTSAATLEEVRNRQTAFNALRDEILINDWGVNILAFFGIAEEYRTNINGTSYIVVADATDEIFSQINSGYTPINFDESIVQIKQNELSEALLSFEGGLDVEIAAPSDAELLDPARIAAYVTAVNAAYDQVESLSGAHQEAKLTRLWEQVSDVIDRLTTSLNDTSVGVSIPEVNRRVTAYNSLITSELGNAWNTSFEEALDEKNREIVEHDILNVSLEEVDDPEINTIFIEIWSSLWLFETETIDDGSERVVIENGVPRVKDIFQNHPFWLIISGADLSSTTMQDVIEVIDAHISSRPDIADELRSSRRAIIHILWNSLSHEVATWLREVYGNSANAIEDFFNTLTR